MCACRGATFPVTANVLIKRIILLFNESDLQFVHGVENEEEEEEKLVRILLITDDKSIKLHFRSTIFRFSH